MTSYVPISLFQDVLIRFLTTDDIKLNVIDAEDPEVGTEACSIAADKAFSSSEECWYLSYFSTKTCCGYSLYVFVEK